MAVEGDPFGDAQLLRQPAVRALVGAHGHTLVAGEARALLEDLRARALDGTLDTASVQADALAQALAARLSARLAPRMRRVLNLTGTVIHTNLGRAVLAPEAVAAPVPPVPTATAPVRPPRRMPPGRWAPARPVAARW